jgi:hypothetical protein
MALGAGSGSAPFRVPFQAGVLAMFTALLRRLVAPLSVLALVSIASAQVPVLYRLDGRASWTQGCFPPCTCPTGMSEDLFGTFTLTFDHSSPNYFDYYRIENVNWVLMRGAAEQRITGSGQYQRGGQVAIQQELTLDLSIDGATTQHFDSGLVLGAQSFPSLDLTVSMHGMVCYDIAIRVASSPVPASAITPYTLHRSGYFEGCFPPCTCPLLKSRLIGSFDLVDLGPSSNPMRLHYALVDAQWSTVSTLLVRSFTGFGVYSLDLSVPQHRLVCDLTDQSGVTQRFDSHFVVGGTTFPRVDIDMSLHDMVCDDQVFRVHAVP